MAGLESRRGAGVAYQKTDRGKKNHAARQQVYLLGLEGKMTHHVFPGLAAGGTVFRNEYVRAI